MDRENQKIKLGISTCLLGEKVRYDGGHKLDRYLVNTLGQYTDYVSVCPEVEAGFNTPREAFRLVGDVSSPRLITVRTKHDVTDQMKTWARERVEELEKEGLRGFIFKSKSPSSGMERVKVYNEKGVPVNKGVGIFARIFKEHFPLLPVEEDGRLHDIRIRENFIERIFVYDRWRKLLKENTHPKDLIDFHTRHKLLIMSHSEKNYRLLGKLVGSIKQRPFPEILDSYQQLMMEALALKTTIKKNVNVLQHIMGYFKKHLSGDEKQELLEIIDNYRYELIPLIVPTTLINHYVRKYGQPYLEQQVYLNPHPLELKLRNHA